MKITNLVAGLIWFIVITGIHIYALPIVYDMIVTNGDATWRVAGLAFMGMWFIFANLIAPYMLAVMDTDSTGG